MAELIKKCQDENNKALVAQYKEKVLGFISISNEIDLSVLYKCFELEQFDFLLKPKFVELMKHRKIEIQELNEGKKQTELVEFKQQIENEKVLSHRIANTNLFQIYLTTNKQILQTNIVEYARDFESREKKKEEDQQKNVRAMQFKFYKGKITGYINELTKEFVHKKPSAFFRENPEYADDVYGTLIKPDSFLIKILENFGL